MLLVIYSTIICILLLVFAGLLGLIYNRYGTRTTAVTLLIALLFAFLNTQIVRIFLLPSLTSEEYDEEAIFPAEEWRRIHFADESLEGFEFRPEQGLFVLTQTSDIQLTQDVPGCLPEGGIAQFYRSSSSTRPIRETIAPVIRLPSPPEAPAHKIMFNIPILDTAEVDTVILGASGFAAYSNGEIWCTEREVQRGPMIGAGLAFALGLKSLGYLTLAFIRFLLL